MQIYSRIRSILKVMSAKRLFKLFIISFSLLMSELAISQWVFVARHAIGRIEQITQNPSSPNQPPTEVVTVILDAPAQRIFDIATNTIQKNQNVSIVNSDQQKLTLKISQGDQIATLAIKPLSDDTSQLMIIGSSLPGQDPQTTRIVDGVMRLCNELGRDCKLAS